MAADLDLCFMHAADLARAIAVGSLSPVAVVENALARIAETHDALNAFCFVHADEALARARAVEADRAAGRSLPPLAGVPVALKDLTPTKGKRTTLGSRTHEHWVPDRDAVIAERLAAAGAVLVGKTTTPEFAYAGVTQSPLWGVTRNPWDLKRTPGGSSGGSGAAVAAGCVPLAEGTDMGGSIRIPAAFCGLVGLKPSLGRIPMDILPSGFDDLSHFGPLARTVADARLFLELTQGPDERDPQSQLRPLPLDVGPADDLGGLTLALSHDLGFFAVDDGVAANLEAAAKALEGRGARIIEVDLGWTAALEDAWDDLWGVFMEAYFGHLLPEWRDRMDPGLVAYMDRGRAIGAVAYKRIEILRTAQWRSLAEVFERADALICPTCTRTAPLHGAAPAMRPDGRHPGPTMTGVFNLVPLCPVLSVPTGIARDGLPTAMQIVGRRGDDGMVLRLGAALEGVRPWADRRPPL
jgi:Asp-tRNA(Asn)/Glu-tRNA(Gln) amidotransferase A subunit family amidase